MGSLGELGSHLESGLAFLRRKMRVGLECGRHGGRESREEWEEGKRKKKARREVEEKKREGRRGVEFAFEGSSSACWALT